MKKVQIEYTCGFKVFYGPNICILDGSELKTQREKRDGACEKCYRKMIVGWMKK